MKIDITMQQCCSDNEISGQVARQTRLVLGRFATSIQTITIRITNTDGPKNRVNIRCTVSMKLLSTGDIVVQEGGENVFLALTYCLSRVNRTISRLLERRRNTPNRINKPRTEVENEIL